MQDPRTRPFNPSEPNRPYTVGMPGDGAMQASSNFLLGNKNMPPYVPLQFGQPPSMSAPQGHFSSHLQPPPQLGGYNVGIPMNMPRQAWGNAPFPMPQPFPQQFVNQNGRVPSVTFSDQQPKTMGIAPTNFTKFVPSTNPLLQNQQHILRSQPPMMNQHQFQQTNPQMLQTNSHMLQTMLPGQKLFQPSENRMVNPSTNLLKPTTKPIPQEEKDSDDEVEIKHHPRALPKQKQNPSLQAPQPNVQPNVQPRLNVANNSVNTSRLAQNFHNTKPTKPSQKIEKKPSSVNTSLESDAQELAAIAPTATIPVKRQVYHEEEKISARGRPKKEKPPQQNPNQVQRPTTEKINVKSKNVVSEYDRAMSLYDKGKLDEALEHFQECLSIYSRTKMDDTEMMANIFLGMGIVYYAQGQEVAAMEQYERCIETLEDKFGKSYPGTVSALVNMALVLSNQGRYDDSLKVFFKAQKLAENILGEDRLSLADVYHNIGVIYDKQGKLDYALEFYEKSLRIRERLQDGAHPSLALTYENMAMIMKDQNKIKKAVDYQTKVVMIRKKYMGGNSFDYALSLHNMGLIHLKDNKLDLALPFFSKAHKIRSQSLGPEHELTRNSLNLMEEVEKRINDRKKKLSSLSAHTSVVTDR
jgi:tetratricopeptide (TPR) repeat protein